MAGQAPGGSGPAPSGMVTGREIKGTETCGHVVTGLGAPLMTGTYSHSLLEKMPYRTRTEMENLIYASV